MPYDYDKDLVGPSRKLFGIGLRWVLFIFVMIVAAILLFTGVLRPFNREVQKFDAETSRQVYEGSRSYQQGTQLDLARYCAERERATGAGRTAVEGLIRDTAATYHGPRSANVDRCLASLGL